MEVGGLAEYFPLDDWPSHRPPMTENSAGAAQPLIVPEAPGGTAGLAAALFVMYGITESVRDGSGIGLDSVGKAARGGHRS
jgi:hypothetical protein